MRNDSEGYEHDDLIWYTGEGDRQAGVVTNPRDGYELEIVIGNRATTAHVTELEPR